MAGRGAGSTLDRALRRVVRGRGATLVSGLALVVATTSIVVLAVAADGHRSHDAQLNDGGIWVTSSTDGYFGRVNKPIGQLDGGLFAELGADLDVVQDGATVLGLNRTDGSLAPIDPATVEHPEGEIAGVVGDADVVAAGGTVAALDPAQGALWATVADPGLGAVGVSDLDRESDPLDEVGGGASMTVTVGGDVVAVSAEDDTVTDLVREGSGYRDAKRRDLPGEVGDAARVTSVGEAAVVLDPQAGRLWTLARGTAEQAPRSDVPVGSVLQQPGPAADSVTVATADSLLSVPLSGGEPTLLAQTTGGRAAAPVRLGACRYGAWAGGGGTVATVCAGQEPRVVSLDSRTSDLVFRVNRGQVLLNDRTTGFVWNIDSDQPTRLDDWDAFERESTEEDEEQEQENDQQGDQRPPVANPDTLGARPGRTTVLHPLDNDTAPGGRLLSIRSVENVTGQGARVTISPDGQNVQITLPPDARGRAGFVYRIDDGREDKTAQATVTVPVRQQGQNAEPTLRLGFEPRTWTVPAGGVLDVPVLPDWRDRADGDPLAVTGAEAVGGQRSGAEARPTADGRVRVNAPAVGGALQVHYSVSDGIGADTERTFRVNVQDPKDREAHPGVAEPDVVTGTVGEPIHIAPLENDQPGSDPITPDAELALAGKLASPGGSEIVTDLVQGTLTFTASVADTYFLEYDAAYGNAPLDQGAIRVDVRNPKRPPDEPIAMPDTAMLNGQSAVLVDVLGNDMDPAGGMLTVQGAAARTDNQLDVAVVDGRWVRVAARQGQLMPNPQVVGYEITNGARSGVEGQIVVTQREAPQRDVPVTEKDAVTVRAGAAVAVPVLDNDFSPSGGELSLVEHVADEGSGQLTVRRPGDEDVPTGQAFVTGNFVRYVAPPDLEDSGTFTLTYLAANSEGVSAPGRLEVTVVPADRPNQLPEPPTLEGRVVAGDTVDLRIPGADIDPDGDAVTLRGISSAPQLGRVVRTGAGSITYQSFPGSAGTDQFSYEVTDSYGGTAEGTVRVAVSPADLPQPPLAVDDQVTVEPGRTATVDLLANDHIASGDRVTARLLDAPDGARLESAVGPLEIRAPGEVGGRAVEVVYEVSNGIATSRGVVTLRTAEPFNNPPVAFDAFGTAEDGDSIEVDVLETAYDPDGPTEDLVVSEVFAPRGVQATVTGGTVTVTRGPQPVVVPFRVEDADGGATTASLYVPPAGNGLPHVAKDALIEVDPGEEVDTELSDHVVNPSGEDVSFTLRDRIWSSPEVSVGATVTGEGTFRVQADGGYEGPGAVSFEVTTGTSVDDPEGRTTVLTVPVQVGETRPILRCPREPLEIPQGSTMELDVAAVCHVWTVDPEEADQLDFTADWQASVDGLSIVEPEGAVIEIAAGGDARAGITAELQVRTGGSDPAVIPVRVIETPPPSLAAVRIADMKAGETRTVDLSPYLRPGVPEPVPTLMTVTQESGLDIEAVKTGPAELTLTTGERVDGTARFRMVMSDVANAQSEERQVTGFLELEVLDVPDTPTTPVPGRTVRSEEVNLAWRAPAANGSPIERYEVRDDRGEVTRCGTTTCDVGGLVNGERYRFQARAVNAVGVSPWSGMSAPATPDAKPGIVGPVEMVSRGDGTITLRWAPPTAQTSAIESYWVTWKGSSGSGQSTRQPGITLRNLDNNVARTYTVVAENALDYGPPRTSAEFQTIGTPGTPQAPQVTDQQTGDGQTAVTVDWPDVDPNGPGPVQYTVYRNGSALPGCTQVTASRCDNSGVEYDGTRYAYRVDATNNGGSAEARSSPRGPATTWSAVGRPAAWDDSAWSVTPTGADTMARVTFTVPPSRGAQSQVSILVDGTVRQTQQRSGAQQVEISVGDNDRPHAVSLRVCNEQNSCTTSGSKSVQTWGPLVDRHIISAVSESRKVGVSLYEVRWRITVDTNGAPATAHLRGKIGQPGKTPSEIREETLGFGGVDVQTATTGWREVPAENSEILRLTLTDAPRDRSTFKEFRYNAPQRDPISVRISQGTRCSDSPGSPHPRCNSSGTGEPCLDVSCARIRFESSGFRVSRVECDMYDSYGYYVSRSIETNTTDEPGLYYGYPDRTVWAICNGVESNRYDWPSSPSSS